MYGTTYHFSRDILLTFFPRLLPPPTAALASATPAAAGDCERRGDPGENPHGPRARARREQDQLHLRVHGLRRVRLRLLERGFRGVRQRRRFRRYR